MRDATHPHFKLGDFLRPHAVANDDRDRAFLNIARPWQLACLRVGNHALRP
jgi:hypothetical protein